ncbi:MAG: FGGY-family carbohydrate kinase [Candidatus Thorarchaeota archaeon]
MNISEKKYILAIDHGTQGPKSAIVSTEGDILEWAYQETPIHAYSGGFVEQDPNDWWNAIKSTAKKVIESGMVAVDDIIGVSNTSQWSGTVAVDKDGNHLTNSIIWMDTRGAKYIEKFYKSLFQVSGYAIPKILKWIRRTGGGPSQTGKDSIAHILWIKNELPEIYQKTCKFLEPQDFINLKLTGKFAASTVSIHFHWMTDIRDINNVRYSKKLIKGFKIDPKKLPELKSSIDVLGPLKSNVADELGLNKDVKVIMGAPDFSTATIGSGAVSNYETHIYIGTSDWCTCHVPYKKTDISLGMASIPSAIPGKYMVANEQEIAGGALSFLRDNILYHKDELLKEEAVPDVYKIFDRIVENVPAGSNNLIFTPWLVGERTPIDDRTIRGGIYNLSLEMSREHIIRAIFEGVAYNIKWLFIGVENFIQKWKMKENPEMTKKSVIIPELNIIGGGAQSNIWCQIFADVLNRNIKQMLNPIQANARGAAFVASVGLGYLKWDEIARCCEISNIYTPNPDHRKIYDKLFEEYINIYKTMRKTYKRLNS